MPNQAHILLKIAYNEATAKEIAESDLEVIGMKVVVVRSPKILSGILRAMFKIKKEA